MEPIIDLNEPMEVTIDLDSDHEANFDCGSFEAIGPAEDSVSILSHMFFVSTLMALMIWDEEVKDEDEVAGMLAVRREGHMAKMRAGRGCRSGGIWSGGGRRCCGEWGRCEGKVLRERALVESTPMISRQRIFSLNLSDEGEIFRVEEKNGYASHLEWTEAEEELHEYKGKLGHTKPRGEIGLSQYKGHPLEESTPQVDQNHESNESVVEGTCDDVAKHHIDVLHDDLHVFQDFINIVPLADIQRTLKGKNMLIEKPSKKPKTRDGDVSHCPVAIEETSILVASDSYSVDLYSEDDDDFSMFGTNTDRDGKSRGIESLGGVSGSDAARGTVGLNTTVPLAAVSILERIQRAVDAVTTWKALPHKVGNRVPQRLTMGGPTALSDTNTSAGNDSPTPTNWLKVHRHQRRKSMAIPTELSRRSKQKVTATRSPQR
ncbi:hypothetical protein Sjap_007954 [Stephania japonica]|uniref:Uncharacterized protein n=1 Tax=Stephania japonica TaxID=461633 RepID=A0AAP0JPE4_9MAGN